MAKNSKGNGAYSNEVNATPITIASAPQSFTAINGSAQVLLNWTSPVSNGGSAITGYDIYRGTVSGAETLLTTVGNISSYLDTLGLSNGITYYYLICAINSVGLGTNSSRISTIPFTIPGIPQSLTASPGNNQVFLNWTAPVFNGGSVITGYSIYQATSSGAETFLTNTSQLSWYIDSSALNGFNYFYIIAAYNAAGLGPNSTEATTMPNPPPSPPQNLACVLG